MYNASGLTDCSFDFAVFSRSDCKLQSKINGATGKPILETNFGYPGAVGRSVAPVTFSSWNIPFAGPTVADAMNEVLPSDDGFETAEIAVYFTSDYNAVDVVSRGFERYDPGVSALYPVFNSYVTTSSGTQIPW
eukprot:4910842-Pleurochrysis_carterae.AAC.1